MNLNPTERELSDGLINMTMYDQADVVNPDLVDLIDDDQGNDP